ncbi:MAG: hypothetical protein HYU41_26415 [Candidatus Rokubacteria bacterium]|nr:hypothetical protein [Candidatus Rokubacteria bacterium]
MLASVSRLLHERGTAFALIGAGAMAIHGVSRSTSDLDLLVTDLRCLTDAYWSSTTDLAIDIRRGDATDPLAGVVRVRARQSEPLDIVVGRHAWQATAVAAASPSEIAGVTVPVVRRRDLVLLKLYAGGPQDAWDITQLLGVPDGASTVSEVDAAVESLPVDAQALWRRVRPA